MTKKENELNFKCRNLPWYPVQLQTSKFITYLPEDVASALNTYLEACLSISLDFLTSLSLLMSFSYATFPSSLLLAD